VKATEHAHAASSSATEVSSTSNSGTTAVQPRVLAIPADAVLTTGQRQLVYVEREPGKYELVEPKLGPRAGNYYPVMSGLAEGDRVVTRGSFLLDSQYQITGRTSLLDVGPSSDAHDAHDAVAGFTAKEQANLDKLSPQDRALAMQQRICPITGARLGSMGKPHKMQIGDRTLLLCCQGCEGQVKADPAATLKKLEAAGPSSHTPPDAAEPQGADHG
jgi:membrane fusion protein, copper/silver efflux system